MTTIKLLDLLHKGNRGLTGVGLMLGDRLVVLDCTGVDAIAPEQLDLLLANIPDDWDAAEIGEIIDPETVSESFGEQLSAWIDRRAGRAVSIASIDINKNLDNQPLTTPVSEGQPVTIHPILALDRVIEEYKSYLQSEFRAKDPALKEALERELDEPRFLAQEPFFQAHRPFKAGARWRDLPIDLKLAQVMEQRSRQAHAYLHQSDAIEHLLGSAASPLVVTTGTGSGKTESFLLPVIQNAIADATHYKRAGLTAILIYPMNALANDQKERIEAYLREAGFAGTVTVGQYDRSTKQATRNEYRTNPPHILLTNYMMLEYLLVRPADRDGIFANHRCRFLVLDEVHTYRGTLGSNIALLVRRLRAHLTQARHDWRPEVPEEERARRFPTLLPVGTSATIKSVNEDGRSRAEVVQLRDEAVQDFFGKLTGAERETIRVIGEELIDIEFPAEAHYPAHPVDIGHVNTSDAEAVRRGLCQLANQPLDSLLIDAARHYRLLWDLNRWLIRAPLGVSQIVDLVRSEVPERKDAEPTSVQREVEAALAIGAALPDGTPGALRLRAHRFIRGGWQFHRCVNPVCGKLYPMGEEHCVCGYRTAPLYLCRNCGADYLRFTGNPDEGALRPSGVLTDTPEWLVYEPARFDTEADVDDDVVAQGEEGTTLVRNVSTKSPTQVKGRAVLHGSFDPTTLHFSAQEGDYERKVTLAPGRTVCLSCGGTAGSRSVLTSVALGTSAAIKVLSEGLVGTLAEVHQADPDHDGKERLLVFSDSRQDAAHQARFIIFASRYDRLRRRLMHLLKDGAPLSFQGVVELLGKAAAHEHDNPHVPSPDITWLTEETLRRVRAWEEAPLLDDLAVYAGFRGTLVNLGLMRVTYHELHDYAKVVGGRLAEELGIDTEQLTYLCRCILDEMRVRGAFSRDLLRYHPRYTGAPEMIAAADWERRVKQPRGYAATKDGRAALFLDKTEVPSGITVMNPWRRPGAGGRGPSLERIFRQLLNRFGASSEPKAEQMVSLLEFLRQGSFLIAADLFGAREQATLLQVNAETLRVELARDGRRLHCSVCGRVGVGDRVGLPCPQCHGLLVLWPDAEVMRNRAVQRILKPVIVPLVAGEHTAQVPNEARRDLEDAFKAPAVESKVNLLACSPTLEMGIDVGGLDAVVLRNIPPRPDNYAQRGGRAGRRTRVGLVLGYARNTPHDQYFYDKPTEMIAGEVPAPALALGNRDVILRHLNAIAFGAADPGLAGKMVAYVSPTGEIQQDVVDTLIAAVKAQTKHALRLAQAAWGEDILVRAGLTADDLATALNALPARIQDVIERTARQVAELRRALDTFATHLLGRRAGTHAADLIASLLGIESEKDEADDRSGGYPLRRFAEFGILPGYEFPTEPASLRLFGDKYEADPVTVARRFGIAQFQPEAQVYARAKRWKVIGLDTSSPWNPVNDEPAWSYRVCSACHLRFNADEPRCPRCQTDLPGKPLPGAEFAGFLASRDEGPILDEEERYATRNLVKTYPQWDGDVIGRWSVDLGGTLRLSREEDVRWVNEGIPPTDKELRAGVPLLHGDGKGYLVCSTCGHLLDVPPQRSTGKGGKKKVSTGNVYTEVIGHSKNCPKASVAPQPVAIVTHGKAEILRLLVPIPPSLSEADVQPWGLTLGTALRAGMRHLYMLDGSEIEFELEGPWQIHANGTVHQQLALTFIDPSIGGSGYLRRIASELHLVAQRAIDHLDHPNCQSACYRCLKSYQNQRYHDQLRWPLVMGDLEVLAQEAPHERALQAGDLDDPRPWLDAYTAGVGSPLELRFLRLFEQHGFYPQKQVGISLDSGNAISVADFAVPERRLAIYIDGAAFHTGTHLRRDRYIRERLRASEPPWQVEELRASDLSQGKALVERLLGGH